MIVLDPKNLKSNWIDIQPKWNSFLNSNLISLIIIDKENGFLYKNDLNGSVRTSITTDCLFNEINDYIKDNPMIKVSRDELILPEIISWPSNSAEVFINPLAVMKIKPDKIKIRTTFADESIIYFKKETAFKKILCMLDKYFDIPEIRKGVI